MLLIYLFTVQISSGQVFEWAIVEPVNISTNPALLVHSVTLDTAGHPIHARLIKKKLVYATIYFGDFSLDKYDSFGTFIRSDTLTGKVHIKNILTDKINNLVVYGSFRDTLWVNSTHHLIIPPGSTHEFILKYDSQGEVVWLKDYTQIDPDFDRLNTLVIDNSNSIWAGVQNASNHTFVKKLETNGNISTTFTQTNVRSISGLSVDTDGNIWVTGSTTTGNQSFNGFMANGPFPYAFYVTRYSPGGVAHWVQFIEDGTFKTPRIACDNSGNAYLSDHLNGPFVFGSLLAQGAEWTFDFFLTKIDSAGNFIWLREVPAGNPIADASIGSGGFLTCSGDGDVYVAGFSRNNVNWGSGIISTSFGYYDVLILKYSTSGELLWVKNAGGSGFDRADAISIDKEGNCYITGGVGENTVFDSLTFSGQVINSFLAKIKTDDPTSIELTQINPPQDIRLYQNYPNPFNPATNIGFWISDFGFVSLKIYDVNGREVTTLVSEELTPGSYEYRWDARGMASGMYFYRLETKGFRQMKKMLLIR
jgi:hypothetical protein